MNINSQNNNKEECEYPNQELRFHTHLPDAREYLEGDVQVSCVIHDDTGGTIDVERSEDALVQFMTRRRSLSIITTTGGQTLSEIIDPYADIKFATGTQLSAGRQVFISLMLNAWRKRLNDCTLLQKQHEAQHRLFNKTKDELNYYTLLFQHQQKCSDDLNLKLKQVSHTFKATKTACEDLTAYIATHRDDISLMKHQLQLTDGNLKRFEAKWNLAKVELFDILRRENNLYTDWLEKQRQEDDLLDTCQRLSSELDTILNQHELDIKICRDGLVADEADMALELKKLYNVAAMLEHENQDLRFNYMLTREQLSQEFEAQKLRFETLKIKLGKYPSLKVSNFWKKVMFYGDAVISITHWMAHIFIPVVPQPKLSSCIGLERALMKIVKH